MTSHRKCSPKPDWNNVFSDWRRLLAFGFGSGLLKPGPGTWGTLMGAGVLMVLHLANLWLFWLVLGLLTLIGDYICQYTSDYYQVHDHSGIVLDEIVAIGWVLGLMPGFSQIQPFMALLLAIGIFRLFDILKPWPIRWFDAKIHSGLGIMLDDFIAALMTLVVLWGIHKYEVALLDLISKF